MIEKSCTRRDPSDPQDLKKMNKWPDGRIWLVLEDLNNMFRGSSFLDRIKLDEEKAKVVLNAGEHPDEQFHRLYLLTKQFRHKEEQPSMNELIAQLVRGSIAPYTVPYTQKLIAMESEKDGQKVLNQLQKLGNEIYTANQATGGAKAEIGLSGVDPRDKWTSNGKKAEAK